MSSVWNKPWPLTQEDRGREEAKRKTPPRLGVCVIVCYTPYSRTDLLVWIVHWLEVLKAIYMEDGCDLIM